MTVEQCPKIGAADNQRELYTQLSIPPSDSFGYGVILNRMTGHFLCRSKFSGAKTGALYLGLESQEAVSVPDETGRPSVKDIGPSGS